MIPSFHNRHQPQNFNQLLMVCQKRYSGLRFNLVMNSCWRYIYKITPLFLSFDWHFFDCFIMQSASQTGSLYISVPFRSVPLPSVVLRSMPPSSKDTYSARFLWTPKAETGYKGYPNNDNSVVSANILSMSTNIIYFRLRTVYE